VNLVVPGIPLPVLIAIFVLALVLFGPRGFPRPPR
jgi:hypothetical protein